jgi:site-specific DNA-adenine methylase
MKHPETAKGGQTMPDKKGCPNCRHACYHAAASCEGCGYDFIEDNLPRLRDDRLRSPYPFFGTKKKVADDLWRLFGDVRRYVEPFLGSAAMLLARPKDRRIHCVVSDKNRQISNLWRAVQFHPEEVAQWCDWPVNEADLHARHSWLESQPFEEAIAGTPCGQELLDRLHRLEAGLRQDPLWCDPKIAGWWAWGQSCWIGGDFCTAKKKPPTDPPRKCRQVGVISRSGVLAKQPPVVVPGGVVRERPKTNSTGVLSKRRPETHNFKGVHVYHRHRQGLLRYFRRLQAELRDVIVCCGDWTRVVTPCVLGDRGAAAVLLDPPYREAGKKRYGRYHDNLVSGRVRAWAIENGTKKWLRIILCGYDGEHEMPADWSVYRWDHAKGMSKAEKNLGRERVWCSPAIRPLDRPEALVRVK